MKLDPMNTWITSDLHLGHDRDFIWGPRGFSSIEEHDAEIIKLWNETIPPNGDVYILGDLILGDNDTGIEKLEQLNGNLYIAIGNHCTEARVAAYRRLPNVKDIQIGYRYNVRKISLLLTHYPTIVKNFDDPKPVWCLCGHSHTKDKWLHKEYGCYHCELDAHENRPVLLNDIINEIKNREA